MKVSVLGTGMVGKTIAKKLQDLGHHVFMGTRNPQKTLQTNEKFAAWKAENPGIELLSFADSVAESESLVFNCTGGMISLTVLESVGSEILAGKILVDIANPLDFSQGMPPGLNPVNTDSLGEQIQAAYPELKVVKTLNTMNANIMVNPALVPGNHSVFVSGNEENAKEKVKELLQSFGWAAENIIDLGDITTARGSEMLLPIWLRLWNALGTANFNFHIQQ